MHTHVAVRLGQLFAAVIPPDDLCNIHLPAALYGQYFSPEYATPTLIRDRTYVAAAVLYCSLLASSSPGLRVAVTGVTSAGLASARTQGTTTSLTTSTPRHRVSGTFPGPTHEAIAHRP